MKRKLTGLLLNLRTRQAVNIYLNKPRQALLLVGPHGSGKLSLAEAIAAELLNLGSPDDLAKYPYFSHLQRKDRQQDISIEALRGVIRTGSLKIPGAQPVRRLILIENAQDLSLPAQNALLKTLEEPPAGTVFILTAQSVNSVLPTLASRTVAIEVCPVGLDDSLQFFSKDYKTPAIEQAWHLSQASVGLMSALLADDTAHPLKQAVEAAKDLLPRPAYERLKLIDGLTADRQQLDNLLDGLERLLAAMHHSAVYKSNQPISRKILAQRRRVSRLRGQLAQNANPRLIGLSLALNLH
ncbi:hypothetical protein HY380_02360 [Candidatus Saccharibacteria bacterium]|nr:hypothetical protein [Candidatus Saccharibacteria bacterium]